MITTLATLLCFLAGVQDIEIESHDYATKSGAPLALSVASKPPSSHLPRPAVLIFGASEDTDDNEDGDLLRELGERLAQRDYIVIRPTLREGGEVRWPQPLEDVRDAIGWVAEFHRKLGVDLSRLAAVGQGLYASWVLRAGLPANEGMPPLRAVVNLSGVVDARSDHLPASLLTPLRSIAGGPYHAQSKNYWDISPIAFVTSLSPAVLSHYPERGLLPASQGSVFKKELDRFQVPNLLALEGNALEHTLEFVDLYLGGGGHHPLVASEDFDSMGGWKAVDPQSWRISDHQTLSLHRKASDYSPPVRSPLHICWLESVSVRDFVLDVDMRTTHEDYPHRDLCLFFAKKSAQEFYYVHLGQRADDRANSIFRVNRAPRISIASERSLSTPWDEHWHHVRLVRDTAEGSIDVYFDDMSLPIMSTRDFTFLQGPIGLGSFDDTGEFDHVRLWGKREAR